MKRLPVIEFGVERPRPWWGIALLLLALLLLALQFLSLNELRDRVESQKEGMARLFVPKASSATAAMSPQDRRRHAQIEVVASYLAAPWDTLLAVFESHGRSGVLLRRLEPDAATGIVRVVGEARNIAMMMDYVLALESDKRLSQVLLLNHDLLKEAEGTPVEFTLSASWRAVGRAAAEAGVVVPSGTEGERP